MVHHAEGGDPGVNFISSTLFEDRLSITVISNTDGGWGPTLTEGCRYER